MNRLAKMRRLTFGLMLAGSATLVAGCEFDAAKKPASQPTTSAGTQSAMTVFIKATEGGDSRDPRPIPSAMVRLVIFLLDLPQGSVSNNADFWKRVDEQVVGAAGADRLGRNGIRCGVVPKTESLFFSQFFDHHPHTLSISHVEGTHTETVALQMDRKFRQQDLFFFNASDQLEGRSYDEGTDRWMLSFGTTPRDPNAVRLTLCPVVTSAKVRLQYTPLNQEFTSPIEEVDRLYDLGLTADVPAGSFFVVAPSADADRSTGIGGRFLINADQAEKKEQVIVIVPSFLTMDGKANIVRDGLIR